MKDKKKIIILIIISVLCCFGTKITASLLGLLIGGKTIITLLLMGLAAVLIVKKTRIYLVFPLTSLILSLMSDLSAVRKCIGYLNGTASVYSLLDERMQELIDRASEFIGDGVIIGAAAVVGVYEVLNTAGTFILILIVSYIARYVILKKENNINKNGGKENDQAHT